MVFAAREALFAAEDAMIAENAVLRAYVRDVYTTPQLNEPNVDTASLQEWLDNGGERIIGADILRFNHLTIRDHTTLRGRQGTILQQVGDGAALTLAGDYVTLDRIHLTALNNPLAICGILLEAGSDQYPRRWITLRNLTTSTFVNEVTPLSWSKATLWARGITLSVKLERCEFTFANGHGVFIESPQYNNWSISDCRFYFHYGYGFYAPVTPECYSVGYCGMQSNIFESNVMGQIYADALYGSDLSNNHLEQGGDWNNIPMVLGHNAACKALSIRGNVFACDGVPYLIDMRAPGAQDGIEIISNRFTGKHGETHAAIHAGHLCNSRVANNEIYQDAFPLLDLTNSHCRNLQVQHDLLCDVISTGGEAEPMNYRKMQERGLV